MKGTKYFGSIVLLIVGVSLSMGGACPARGQVAPNQILWRNTSNATLNYFLMSGSTFDSYGTITATIPNVWQVVGQADMDGNYVPDLVWQNSSTGDVAYFLMDATPAFTGTWGYIAHGLAPESGWDIVAVADMDGDGNPDLVYQNRYSGDVTYLQVVNCGYTGAWQYLSEGISPQWHVIAAIDLFGDGNNDLVWWNSDTGDVTYIRMQGITQTGQWGYIARTTATTANDWRAVGMADFTGDGYPDIVWQNTQTGDVTYYEVTYNAAVGGPQWDGNSGYLSEGIPPVWVVTGVLSGNVRLAASVWPKFHHDNQNSGRGGGSGTTGAVKWQYTTGDWVDSSPTIGSDGTVYVGSDDSHVYALDGTTGAFKWKFKTGNQVQSSPSIGSDGTLYVPSYDGKVYALDGATGAVKWTASVGGDIFSQPSIGPDGAIYVCGRGNLFVLNGATGALKWQFTTGTWSFSSPAIGSDGTIYIGSGDNSVYALNGATGAVKWRFATGTSIDTSPAIGFDGTIYIGSQDDVVYALNGATGALIWKYTTGGPVESTAALGSDGTVYIGSDDDKMYALDGATGALKWTYTTAGNIFSSPALGADGTLYFGSEDFSVYALNGATGALKWKYATGGQIYSSPAIGSDGTVYIGAEDNNLYAFH